MNSKSKVIPILETIFQNKGVDGEQWHAVLKIVSDRTDE